MAHLGSPRPGIRVHKNIAIRFTKDEYDYLVTILDPFLARQNTRMAIKQYLLRSMPLAPVTLETEYETP